MSDPRRTFLLALALPILLGAAIRVIGVSQKHLYFDEAASVLNANASWDEMYRMFVESEKKPPLFFLCLKALSVLGAGEVGYRYFTVLLGTALIGVVFFFARDLCGERVAFFAAMFVAASPALVWTSQFIRYHSLLALTSTLSTWFLWRMLQEGRIFRSNAVGYVLSTAAALYTFYFALFLIGAQTLSIMAKTGKNWRRTFRLIAMQGLAITLFLPWLPTFFGSLSWAHGKSWLPELRWWDPPNLIRNFAIAFPRPASGSTPVYVLLGAATLLLSGGALWAFFQHRRQPDMKFLLPLLLLPCALVFLITLTIFPVYSPPYLYFLIPLFLIAVARGLDGKRFLLYPALVLSLTGVVYLKVHPDYQDRGMRDLVTVLEMPRKPTSIYHTSPFTYLPSLAYRGFKSNEFLIQKELAYYHGAVYIDPVSLVDEIPVGLNSFGIVIPRPLYTWESRRDESPLFTKLQQQGYRFHLVTECRGITVHWFVATGP